MGLPAETSWHATQSVTPLIDWCARESGPGEICAIAGFEVDRKLNTIHPRMSDFERLQRALTMQVIATVVGGSTRPLTADTLHLSNS